MLWHFVWVSICTAGDAHISKDFYPVSAPVLAPFWGHVMPLEFVFLILIYIFPTDLPDFYIGKHDSFLCRVIVNSHWPFFFFFIRAGNAFRIMSCSTGKEPVRKEKNSDVKYRSYFCFFSSFLFCLGILFTHIIRYICFSLTLAGQQVLMLC